MWPSCFRLVGLAPNILTASLPLPWLPEPKIAGECCLSVLLPQIVDLALRTNCRTAEGAGVEERTGVVLFDSTSTYLLVHGAPKRSRLSFRSLEVRFSDLREEQSARAHQGFPWDRHTHVGGDNMQENCEVYSCCYGALLVQW